ncbi:MAG: isochorismatase family protein, partial [Marmoricola sp.]
AYSMFEAVDQDGTTLAALLEERGIGAVDVVGIATDYCVRATVVYALGNGLQVAVLAGMVAAVAPATGATAVEEMRAAGARWEVER